MPPEIGGNSREHHDPPIEATQNLVKFFPITSLTNFHNK